MSYTVIITETNVGYATFADKEDAEIWMEEPDYDQIKWSDILESKTEMVEDPD
jgi:hypothetical protein